MVGLVMTRSSTAFAVVEVIESTVSGKVVKAVRDLPTPAKDAPAPHQGILDHGPFGDGTRSLCEAEHGANRARRYGSL